MSKSCINFMLATKKFITLNLHAVFYLCTTNRDFIFKKRIKKSLKIFDNFSVCVSNMVAQQICQHSIIRGSRQQHTPLSWMSLGSVADRRFLRIYRFHRFFNIDQNQKKKKKLEVKI